MSTSRLFTLILISHLVAATYVQGQSLSPKILSNMDLQDLMSLEVSSVSRKPERLQDTAAAVFVITREDIRRSGAKSLPELLRLAPGVQVAQIDANRWAISIRGFNRRFSNKLLVLIDGRTVYSPVFSGVYWDQQDLVLRDIERIEVVRGPGASQWGANAVNGVISIITRPAATTHGILASAYAGNQDQPSGSFRVGGELWDGLDGRLYLKSIGRNANADLTGQDYGDDSRVNRAGFRLDWDRDPENLLTLQGDIYQGEQGGTHRTPVTDSLLPPFSPPYNRLQEASTETRGANLLGRWEHSEIESLTSLQLYADNIKRADFTYGSEITTLDMDFQQHRYLNERHDLIWGLGLRYNRYRIDPSELVDVQPRNGDELLWSGFIQDDIHLLDDRLRLHLGAKLEHNAHSGWEIQPSARALWKPAPRHSVWGSVSRAVRTPSPFDEGATIHDSNYPTGVIHPFQPTALIILGNPDAESETVLAYEIGYRTGAIPGLSLDLAAFYNVYDNLRVFANRAAFTDAQGRFILPVLIENPMQADSWGLELSADWQTTDWWRQQLSYTYTQIDARVPPGHSAQRDADNLGGLVPRHQLSLRSAFDLGRDWEMDLGLRFVDELPTAPNLPWSQGTEIDARWELDARLAWQPRPGLELALVGQNLLDEERLEFLAEQHSHAALIGRRVYLSLSLELEP